MKTVYEREDADGRLRAHERRQRARTRAVRRVDDALGGVAVVVGGDPAVGQGARGARARRGGGGGGGGGRRGEGEAEDERAVVVQAVLVVLQAGDGEPLGQRREAGGAPVERMLGEDGDRFDVVKVVPGAEEARRVLWGKKGNGQIGIWRTRLMEGGKMRAVSPLMRRRGRSGRSVRACPGGSGR